MNVRNHILALVAAAALLSTTGAMAQTEGKLFEGVSTYYLDVITSTECGLSKDFLSKKVMFPLSFTALKLGDAKSDIRIKVAVNAAKMPSSSGRCYGDVTVAAEVFNLNTQIPFNKKFYFSKATLFLQGGIFTGSDRGDVGEMAENYMKELVTTINMDNK